MSGLKNAHRHRDDALGRMHRVELQRVLAAYYRDLGWWVEHVGTGGSTAPLDESVDLRLRRDTEVVLVQCRYWTAKQVTHDVVHALHAIMLNENATGAIVISRGEFTAAAIAAAQRQGRVKLIDDEGLRAMLGTLPESPEAADPFVEAVVAMPAERPRRPGASTTARTGRGHAWRGHAWLWLIAIVSAIGFVLIVRAMLDRTADTAGEPPPEAPRPHRPTIVVHEARYEARHETRPAAAPARIAPPPHRPTAAEVRESQRKADEAIRVIEDTTPAM